ncbi:PLP-dependent transferase [Karstenula rhodostoma CBS 690.94]|uniref:PLP-dependent transferase n=1 Tax=Karstenula rhodostoma CBS 690.94 TaxID=1392251 RepID=A0A9P4U946_9PLEO|nr:PLP-dependent transferase [Karstenula rhodostoma CBS 690.94]
MSNTRTKPNSFSDVPAAPVDPMFVLKKEYDQDAYPLKVDLGAGVLRDQQGACYELAVVKEAKRQLEELHLSHDYRPTTGNEAFRKNAARLMFGDQCETIKAGRIASIQTVAGTGACRIGAVFLKKYWSSTSSSTPPSVHIGTPTWGNYHPLFKHAGFETSIETYPYLDTSQDIDLDSVLTALNSAPDRSIFVFQGCCHNPTGRDYSMSQWTQIAEAMQAKGHFAFFDTAYQGLGHSAPEDAWAVRHFTERNIDILVCQSFSKNAGLYSERVGALHVLCATPSIANNVLDQLRSLMRWEVSSAPAYGAELANILMSNPALQARWQTELGTIRQGIASLRKEFHRQMTEYFKTPSPRTGTVDGWDHILKENGLFSWTGLTAAQTRSLIDKHHVYLPGNGRINVSGLNATNITRVAEAFNDVIKSSM